MVSKPTLHLNYQLSTLLSTLAPITTLSVGTMAAATKRFASRSKSNRSRKEKNKQSSK
ncbi:hypothetical protein V6Z11_D11G193100 [Gossypium hirsutum]